MSQIILDDQLFDQEVLIPIARWITVQRLRELRPGGVIKDERVPEILCSLRQPTLAMIDLGFWNRSLRNPRYGVLCFPLQNDQQDELPQMLRRVLRLPEFHSKAARMGKVARVGVTGVEYWQLGDESLRRRSWK